MALILVDLTLTIATTEKKRQVQLSRIFIPEKGPSGSGVSSGSAENYEMIHLFFWLLNGCLTVR